MVAKVSSLEGGRLDKVISAGEAASAIDKIAAIPEMIWEFTGVLIATKEDSNAVRDVIYNAVKKQHPSATISHINCPVRQGRGIDYAVECYSGSNFIKDGFRSAYAHLYKPEMGLYTPSHMPPADKATAMDDILPPLVSILKEEQDKYSIRVSKIKFEAYKAEIPQFVDQMLEQIVELLK